MSIVRVGALYCARAFRVVSIREAYPFPSLLLCCFRCIPSVLLRRLAKEFFVQPPKHGIGVSVDPAREITVPG